MGERPIPIQVTPLGQSGFRFGFGPDVVYIDPYLSDRVAEQEGADLRRMTPVPIAPERVTGAHYVAVTHAHMDHCDPATLLPLSKASPACRFICPKEVGSYLVGQGIEATRVMPASEQWVTLSERLRVIAVPAAHTEIKMDAEGWLRFVGYVFEFGGRRFYHASDTSPHEEIFRVLAGLRPIDTAFLPVNELLDGVEKEVIIVDSGSTDATLEIGHKHGARIIHISKDAFTFGRSLNVGCAAARGDYLVFVSGHCIPASQHWLARLIMPLREGNACYSYGRQIGSQESRFSECELFKKYYPESGCNNQPEFFCNKEYSKNYKKRYCIDLSSRALDEAKNKIGVTAYFVRQFFDIPLERDFFDCAVSLHTLYHIDKDKQEAAVRKLIAVTKPGKPVIIVYSNSQTLIGYLLMPFRILRVVLRLTKKIMDKFVKTPDLYFFSHPMAWWNRFEDVAHVQIKPWRAFSANHQSIFIPDNKWGKKIFDVLFRLEDRFPEVFLKFFQYPMIVLLKKTGDA